MPAGHRRYTGKQAAACSVSVTAGPAQSRGAWSLEVLAHLLVRSQPLSVISCVLSMTNRRSAASDGYPTALFWSAIAGSSTVAARQGGAGRPGPGIYVGCAYYDPGRFLRQRGLRGTAPPFWRVHADPPGITGGRSQAGGRTGRGRQRPAGGGRR